MPNINSDISITREGTALRIRSPYNRDFVERVRDLGGKFDGYAKTWTVDARDEAAVRKALTDVYGSDGEAPAQTVTVHVDLDKYPGREYDKVIFAGREVARRPGRDMRVRLHDAVVVQGGFDSSGGSMKNPALCHKSGTVLEIRDVPAGHADVRARGVTVVADQVDREALLKERAELIARLMQISELLGPDEQALTAYVAARAAERAQAAEYTVQIEVGGADGSNTAGDDGRTWQPVVPPEVVTGFTSAEAAARETALNQDVTNGDNWRARAWSGRTDSGPPDAEIYGCGREISERTHVDVR